MSSTGMSKVGMVKMGATIAFPLLVCMIPTNDMFTVQIRMFLAITLAAILGFAFEQIDQTVVSILLPIAYTLFHVADGAVAFSSWTNSVVWMTLGGLMLADVANRSGFLQRLALKCVVLTGGTYAGIIWGLCIAGAILSILLAGQGFIPMAALAYGICKALNILKTREAAGIMLTSVLSGVLTTSFTFSAGPIIYASFAGTKMNLSWIEYFTKQPVGIIFLVVMIFVVERMCRPKTPFNGKDYFISEYEKLGKVKKEEKLAIFICLGLLIFLLTAKIHGIDVMWGFALFPLIAYLPGIGFCTSDDMRKTNFGMAFFVAACMSIGIVGTSLGIGDMVTKIITPYIEGKSINLVLFVIYLLCVVLNLLMTPNAIAAAFSLPFSQIVGSLGMNPDAFFLFETVAVDQIFFPYEYVIYLVVFSFGAMKMNDFIRVMSVKVLIATAYLFLLLIPFWKLTGFLYV